MVISGYNLYEQGNQHRDRCPISQIFLPKILLYYQGDSRTLLFPFACNKITVVSLPCYVIHIEAIFVQSHLNRIH